MSEIILRAIKPNFHSILRSEGLMEERTGVVGVQKLRIQQLKIRGEGLIKIGNDALHTYSFYIDS